MGTVAPSGSGADAAAHLEAVHPGEHHVQQHRVEAAAGERREAALPVGGDGDRDVVGAEILGHHGTEARIVLDEERGHGARHAATVSAHM